MQATAAAGAAAGGTTTTTASTIPVTEPIPVLVGMTREVALQRLQDLARVSSSDLTGVARSKSGGSRSLQTKSPMRTKREDGKGDNEGGRGSETSSDRESDDDGGSRVYASQHTQRIPMGAGVKARNFTGLSAAPVLRALQAARNKIVQARARAQQATRALTFSADGSRLVSAFHDGTVHDRCGMVRTGIALPPARDIPTMLSL